MNMADSPLPLPGVPEFREVRIALFAVIGGYHECAEIFHPLPY